jgi:formate hydrogenlyase transcriptional activator
LRARPEDVPLLVRYFVQKFSRRQSKTVEYVPAEVMDALTHYSWPGNVRELENLIERAVLLSPGKELRIPLSELRNSSHGADRLSSGPAVSLAGSAAETTPVAGAIHTLEETQRQHILRALRQTEWRISGPRGAAKLLGIKRTTLQARMRKLGIKRPI